jgi:superfamily II DNA helicase RecQ
MDDAVRRLGMKQHLLHKQSFNRPNLEYAIRKKTKKIVEDIGIACDY